MIDLARFLLSVATMKWVEKKGGKGNYLNIYIPSQLKSCTKYLEKIDKSSKTGQGKKNCLNFWKTDWALSYVSI